MVNRLNNSLDETAKNRVKPTLKPTLKPKPRRRLGGLLNFVLFVFAKVFTRYSAKFRITVGLVGVLTSLVMTADLFDLIPDRNGAIREGRIATAEAVAINANLFLAQSDLRRMQSNLTLVVERNDDILSAAVRHQDGKLFVSIGDHEKLWQVLEDGYSTDVQLQVPIWTGDVKWGQVELIFRPLELTGWKGFLTNPLVRLMGFLSFFGFIIYYFYLGKVLTQLNPSQAIPSRVRSTLDTIAEGLLVLDSRERLVLANQAFATLIGKSADDLLGYKVSAFRWTSTDGEPLGKLTTPWRTALQTGKPQMNTMLRLQIDDATQRTFSANCSPILGSGDKAGGVLVSFDDVTELEQKEIELRKSKDEADAANKSKSEFLANMSHEIRTPMNAILGFTELLKRGYGKDAQQTEKHLNTIHSSGKHLLELINDILDLSKVEAGNLDVEQISFSPHILIREMVTVLGVKAREKGITLTFEPEGELPETIESDPVRLRQIITNLVGNSIKFTENGGVKLVNRLIKSGARPQMAIDVIDTGIGMTPRQSESVFNAFEQADSSITRRFGGTGLGLSISKKFAEALGGDITVRSEMGKGSIFTLVIDTGPLDGVQLLKAEEILSAEEEVHETQQTQWEFPPLHILVVDDGDENRELVKLVLEQIGLTVDTAENGKIGSDMALEINYDMILMDVSMPEMDGYTAARRMREKGLKLPIIALTAHAMGEVEQKCMTAGYTGFMTKPIDIDALIEMMAEYLGGHKKELTEPCQSDQRNTVLEPAYDGLTMVPLVSSLPTDNPRFRTIIEKFIDRLNDQVKVMEKACEARSFDELADLAHWLKGAGGTVGFDIFTELAKILEHAARKKDENQCAKHVSDLRQLAGRIVVEAPSLTDVEEQSSSAPNRATNATNATNATQVADQTLPDQVVSSLLTGDPRMQPIIEKFVLRLNEQLNAMEKAHETGDFDELSDLAHWLKGAGGTVGFDVFTDPAQNLETLAKAQNELKIKDALSILRQLAGKISVPSKE